MIPLLAAPCDLGTGLSQMPADLLWHHYLGHESMDAAASAVGAPRRTAFRVRDRALDLVDMWGFELTITGMGGAESGK